MSTDLVEECSGRLLTGLGPSRFHQLVRLSMIGGGTFGGTYGRAKTIIWELELEIEVTLEQTLRELSILPSLSLCLMLNVCDSVLDSFWIAEVQLAVLLQAIAYRQLH